MLATAGENYFLGLFLKTTEKPQNLNLTAFISFYNALIHMLSNDVSNWYSKVLKGWFLSTYIMDLLEMI